MKRCPTCQKTFTDEHLSFCTEDGTPLEFINTPEDEATVVRPSQARDESDEGADSSGAGERSDGAVPPYQPPGSYVPRDYAGAPKRKAWPWLVGILGIVFLFFAGLGIAAVIVIPNMLRAARTSRNVNSRTPANTNSNLNDRNFNIGSNNSTDDNTPAPTNEAEVLQDLTDLEHEWTVANINADKTKLDRILADDYVGESPNGHRQGKAEYLREAERDTSIQKWDFQDLKLNLTGDRATLTGIINLEVKDERGQNQDLAFRFTDKFVWRDGRWQATGSVVTALKEGTAA